MSDSDNRSRAVSETCDCRQCKEDRAAIARELAAPLKLEGMDPEWLAAYRRWASFLFHRWLDGYPEDLVLFVAATAWAAGAENAAARAAAQVGLRAQLPPEMYTRGR